MAHNGRQIKQCCCRIEYEHNVTDPPGSSLYDQIAIIKNIGKEAATVEYHRVPNQRPNDSSLNKLHLRITGK